MTTEEIFVPKKEKLDEIRNAKSSTATTTVDEKKNATPNAEVKNNATAEVTTIVEEKKPINFDDLTEEQILELANKRGLKVSKETLSPEVAQKQAEIEKADKRKFAVEVMGMTNDQFNEIESVINSDGTDLTKKEFTKSYLSDNPKATKEEVADAYDDYYNIQKSITVKESKVKRDVDGNVVFKDDGFSVEEEEVTTEKPKFDERLVKFGEKRRNAKAEILKAQAKAALENIDTNYAQHKTFIARANDFVKTADKVVNDIDFNAIPMNYKFGDTEIKAIVKLNDDAKKDVQSYLTNQLAGLIISSDKQNDTEEISKQVKNYIRDKYQNQVGESLYRLGQTDGINKGKVGAQAPIERILTSDDSRINELAEAAVKNIPIPKDSPLLHNR